MTAAGQWQCRTTRRCSKHGQCCTQRMARCWGRSPCPSAATGLWYPWYGYRNQVRFCTVESHAYLSACHHRLILLLLLHVTSHLGETQPCMVWWLRRRPMAQASTSCSQTACTTITLTSRVGSFQSTPCKVIDHMWPAKLLLIAQKAGAAMHSRVLVCCSTGPVRVQAWARD